MFRPRRPFRSVLQELAVGLRHGVIWLHDTDQDMDAGEQTRTEGVFKKTGSDARWETLLDEVRKVGAAIEKISATDRAESKMNMEALQGFRDHFNAQYRSVQSTGMQLGRLSRLQWARMTSQEQAIAQRARIDFRGIPDFILRREENDHPYEFANLLGVLGASALYAGEIDTAESYLRRAADLYSRHEARPEYAIARARTSFFLGLLLKGWVSENRPIQSSLEESRHHLEDAANQLSDRPGEFLVPITLAELLSYSSGHLYEARGILKTLLPAIEAQDRIDEGFASLLTRAYIILGNIDLLAGDASVAYVWYTKAATRNPSNYVAYIYAGLTASAGERKEWFEAGLNALQSSLSRVGQDIRTRAEGRLLSVIAAHEIGQADLERQHLQQLYEISDETRDASGFQPLFFSPLSKRILTFHGLMEDLLKYIREPRAHGA